jgi:hypothetical protein
MQTNLAQGLFVFKRRKDYWVKGVLKMEKSRLKPGEKRRVVGTTEEIELKILECFACGSGFVLYDSRDKERLKRFTPAMILEHEQRVAANTEREGTPCKCGLGTYTLVHNKWELEHKGYTVVMCDCGKELECHHFTNTCDCGADYNFSGTRLADRSQWGEDTGEHWMQCY